MRSVGTSRYLIFSLFCSAPIFSSSLQGQTTIGIQPFGTYTTGLDQISVGDLGIHIEIPLYSRAERGSQTGLGLRLIYNGGALGPNQLSSNWGSTGFSASFGSVQVFTDTPPTGPNCSSPVTNYSYAYVDTTGFSHSFRATSEVGCNSTVPTSYGVPAIADDGSGYLLTQASEYKTTVVTPSGATITTNNGPTIGITDSNGNPSSSCGAAVCDSTNSYYSPSVYTDGSSYSVSYRDANNNTETVTTNYKKYPMYLSGTYTSTGQPSTFQVYYVDSVVYPDGTAYHFGYEQSAQNPGFYTGRLASIQVPTGGTISYSYVDGFAGTRPYSSLSYVKTLIRTTQDGQTTYNRQVNSFGQPDTNTGGAVASSTTTVTAPDSTSVHMFIGGGENSGGEIGGLYETSSAIYPGSNTSGTPLKQVTTCYAGATGDCTTQPFSFTLPIAKTSASTSSNGGPSSQIVNMFNAISLPTETDIYDYGASVATTKTITSYATLGNNILNRPASITVQDGSGNLVSQTTYGYDEFALAASSAPNLAAVSGARGNRTSQHDWVNTSPSTTLDTYRKYDTAGQVVTATDPLGNMTQYAYDSATDFCLNTTTYPALPSGIALSTSQTCDPNTGLVATTTNFNKATTTYSYDGMLRMTGMAVTGSNNALLSKVAYAYSGSTLPETITQTVSAAPDPDQVTTTTLDGLGRPTTVVGPDRATVATTYDALGRVQSVSNPYFSTSDSTYGITSYLYDALGRTTTQCQPDNAAQPSVTCAPAKSFQSWQYTGNVTLLTDENSHQRQRTSDALGRLTKILEPDPTSGALAFETDYTYDQLNNLTRVDQWGGPNGSAGDRVRSFRYDSLSRLLYSTNPESGTVSYFYDGDSNVHTRTDARGITTTYSYDPLNRLTGKSYTNDPTNTPPVSYTYDLPLQSWNFVDQTSPTWTGVHQTNLAGQLSYAASGSATNVYGYDALGRTTLKSVCTPTTCGPDHYDMHATYDLAGNTTFSDLGLDAVRNAASPNAGYYYGGLQVAYNGAGQATSGTADLVDANHPAAIVSGLQYSPLGSMKAAAFGGVYSEGDQYSPRGWITSRTGTITATGYARVGTLMHDPAGNVTQLTDSLTNSTATYGTDTLNRLTSYSGPFGAATYGYDAWGNLTSHTNTAGQGYTYSLTLTPQNRVSQTGSTDSGFFYDASGNVLADGLNNYSYDAEGRLAAVNGSNAYLYGPEGERVATVQGGAVSAEYLYGSDGKLRTTLAPGGQLMRGLVYGAGMHLADYTKDGKTVFHLADEVGSLVNTIDQTGTPIESCAANPFGESLNCSSAVDYSENHFTDKKRDQESGLDYFGARYYSSTFGRFMSPDTPLVDQSTGDPQSWNLYSYVQNNPLTNTDPDGQDCIYGDGNGGGYVQGGDCSSDTDGGVFVNGTIDVNSFQYNSANNSSSYTYTPDGGGLGTGFLQGPNLNSGGFEPGSLAAGLFGPQGARYFGPASSVVNTAGSIELSIMAPAAAALAGCTSGGSAGSCAANMALSFLPEVGKLRAGATLLKEAAAAGKGAEILQKGGGAAQAVKEFEALPAVSEQINGPVRVKTLSDGSKAVLYESSSGSGTTVSLQDVSGHTNTKIRY